LGPPGVVGEGVEEAVKTAPREYSRNINQVVCARVSCQENRARAGEEELLQLGQRDERGQDEDAQRGLGRPLVLVSRRKLRGRSDGGGRLRDEVI
jgi:hypothetical protein